MDFQESCNLADQGYHQVHLTTLTWISLLFLWMLTKCKELTSYLQSFLRYCLFIISSTLAMSCGDIATASGITQTTICRCDIIKLNFTASLAWHSLASLASQHSHGIKKETLLLLVSHKFRDLHIYRFTYHT